jgi:dTDP-4-amino-4,6-dideoxygalactose transaminase
MSIPLVDLKAQYRRYKAEFDAALQSVIESCAFVGGPDVAAFAKEFADFCGGGHVTTCGNGTDAIQVAIFGLLGRGDGTGEIIVPTHTFIATSEAIANLGFKPVFADIDPDTYVIDVASARKAITPRTKAIIPVHIYGHMAPMDQIMTLAEEHGLKVIEDAAQAHGATWKGRTAGQYGDATTFSFFPGKNLGAWGDAGAVFTRNAALGQVMQKYANHGRLDKYKHEFEGINSRLDTMQAAILRVKLRHLQQWNNERRQIAKWYEQRLSGRNDVLVPRIATDATHVFHLYVVQVAAELRDPLLDKMKDRGIGAGVHYPVPLHEQPAYSHMKHKPSDFPVTSGIARRIVSLPIFPEMTEEQVDTVCKALIECLEQK